jgi:hypothetical protein
MQIKNIRDLRTAMNTEAEKLTNDDGNTRSAQALAQLGGRIIASIRTQMEYARMRSEKPDIEYMNL